MSGVRSLKGRIQLALVLTAATTLAAGMVVAYMMLGEALDHEARPDVGAALAAGVDAQRRTFTTRRELNELRADVLALQPAFASEPYEKRRVETLLAATCRADDSLLRVWVRSAHGPLIDHTCPRPEPAPAVREMTLTRPLPTGGRLRLTFGLAEEAYAGLQQAGRVARSWAQEAGARRQRMGAYWMAFGVLFGMGVVLAGLLGMRMARRTTRRIEALASATHRVSEGDLAVEVPVEGDDELADLAAAFNLMVREVRERGNRIVYLEKISSWQEIARRLAHEIKNPLTPIQLAIQQLGSGYKGDDPKFTRLLAEVSAIVREEVGTLRRLVSEFSDFARLPDVNPGPADLVAFTREFVRQHPELSQDAAMDMKAPAAPVWTLLDRNMMGRVLTNLVQNAIQAAEEAERIPRVHLVVREEAQAAVLCVSDEGPGISAELLPRIFDPYFTTKQTGTGLGLPICKKIVLQHGGELKAASVPGEGARFEIRLPRGRLAAGAAEGGAVAAASV